MRLLAGDTRRMLLAVSAAVVLHLGVLVTVELSLPEDAQNESPVIRVSLETRFVEPAPELPPPELSTIDPPAPEPQPAAVEPAMVEPATAESAAVEPPPAVALPPEPAAAEPLPTVALPPDPATADSAALPSDTRRTAAFRDTVPPASIPAPAPAPPPTLEPDRYVEPRYPEAARRGSIEGTVVVRFRVDRRGRVENVELQQSSGSDLLDREALRTVQLWRFSRENAGRESVHRIVFRLE